PAAASEMIPTFKPREAERINIGRVRYSKPRCFSTRTAYGQHPQPWADAARLPQNSVEPSVGGRVAVS
ncbi:MAG: hypothetical protein ACK5Q5_18465, partial [Planctomycetaceae bacterium]